MVGRYDVVTYADPAFADVSMERFPIITFTPMEFPIIVIAEVILVDGSKEKKSSS